MKTLWENYDQVAAEAVTQEKRFAAAALAGRNCFLTGMAGTGKSTTLRAFIRDSIKRVDVTAPTGVAALNEGGMPLPGVCGSLLGPHPGKWMKRSYKALGVIPEKTTRGVSTKLGGPRSSSL